MVAAALRRRPAFLHVFEQAIDMSAWHDHCKINSQQHNVVR
jgi:hypothetical protein